MEAGDRFDKFDDYSNFNKAMEGILNSRSEQLKVVVIYFHARSWYCTKVFNRLHGRDGKDGIYKVLKGMFGDEIRLMHVSLNMKQMPWIFDLDAFPSFILLDRNLSELRKFSIEDMMGTEESLLKQCKIQKDEFGAETLVPPDPPYLEIERLLLDCISKVLYNIDETDVVEEKGETSANPEETGVVEEKGETRANPQPDIPVFLTRLRSVISEIEEDYRRQRNRSMP